MFNASKMFFTNRIIELQCLNRFRYFNIVSRTVAPEENCPSPTLKLTLTLNQTLTLTVEQFSSGEIIRIPLIFYDLIISFIQQKTLNSRRHIRECMLFPYVYAVYIMDFLRKNQDGPFIYAGFAKLIFIVS